MSGLGFFIGDCISAASHAARAGNPTILFHVVNTRGGWGAGFSGKVSAVWPEAERAYRQWAAGESTALPWYRRITGVAPIYLPDDAVLDLGNVQVVTVKPQPIVGRLDGPPAPMLIANCCAQFGYSHPGRPAFRLDALALCLTRLTERYPHYHYFCPAVGSGLGGGEWRSTESVLAARLAQVPFAAVYQLPKR